MLRLCLHLPSSSARLLHTTPPVAFAYRSPSFPDKPILQYTTDSRFHASANSPTSEPPAQTSPFRLLRFRRTWTATLVPPAVERATKHALERKWVPRAPQPGASRKAGITRRGISAFWAKTAAARLHRQTKPEAGALQRHPRSSQSAVSETESTVRKRLVLRPRNAWIGTLGGLPTTEEELFHLIKRLCRAEIVRSDSIVKFHDSDAFRGLVSSRTYGLVLDSVFKAGNLRATERVLNTMDKRHVPWDENVLYPLLRTNLRRASSSGVQDIVEILRSKGRAWRETPLNWRRDLGDGLRGKGDRWKIWTSSKGLDHRTREDALAQQRRADAADLPEPFDSTKVYTEDDWRLTRQATVVPDNVTLLHSSDVTALVESLSQDQRGVQALEVAQAWLDAARPPPSLPLSSILFRPKYIRQDLSLQRYSATAIVLLNILCKCLFVRDLHVSDVQDFILYFLKRHSSSDLPLLPSAATLSTLLRANQASHTRGKFERACRVVNWFGERFGLPPRSGYDSAPRRRFTPPSDEVDIVHDSRPVCHVSARVAVFLLDAAIKEHAWLPSEQHTALVQRWWNELDKSGAGWINRTLKEKANDAVKAGLFKPSELWGRRFSRSGKRLRPRLAELVPTGQQGGPGASVELAQTERPVRLEHREVA